MVPTLKYFIPSILSIPYKTLRAIVRLFLSIFLKSSFTDGQFIPSQLYLSIKELILGILLGCFPIFYDLIRLL